MSKTINIGILGCANIAQRFVIPALKELNEFNVIGIASRTRNKANEFAEKFGIRPFFNYKSLLELDELDAVYIPLPNSMHYEWIKKSLNKNLNVLVEKSMACSYEEVIELNSLAKDKNIVLIENFQFRFHSQLKYIKDLVDSGSIGELRNLSVSFGFPPFSDINNIRYKRELGGGALLDAGAYPLKISQIFLGNDIFVDSASLSIPKDKQVDIFGSAYIKQKNGDITSQIAFGFDHYYQNCIELWGSKGKIYTNRIFTAAPGFEPIIELETNNGKEIIKLPTDNHFKNMLKYFYLQILNKNKIDNEYIQNNNQARLIKELMEKNI
ncbi:MAG: Gfo/Idh/MocA family oxidoreductase [Bacteroidota bacterium]|nr:Gfo/Idh/MocA family oxidoreductase [Bacteroidota bacterium]